MSSFESTKRDLQVSRSRKIGSIHGLNGAEDEKEEVRDYFYSLLFGNSDLGVMDYFTPAYSIAYNLVGFDTSKPSLRQGNDSDWKNQFEQAVTQSGDDEFYLTDANGLGESEINESTAWLNDNDPNGTTNQGYVPQLNSLSDVVGSEVTVNADARGGFSTQTEAETQRDTDRGYAEGSKGSDYLLNYRTENSEVYQDISDSLWYVGENGLDQPDYFNDPERQALLDELTQTSTNAQSAIDDLNSYKTLLQAFLNEENEIMNEAEIDQDTNITSDTQSLITDIDTAISNIGGHKTAIDDLYTYFNGFTAANDISGQTGYTQSEFNTKLSDTVTEASSTISTYQTTQSNIISHFGNLTSGWRSARYFWIKQAIKKPDGPMYQLNGISNSRTSTYNDLDDATNDLSAIESNQNRWLPKPITIAAFYEPNIDDETGNILQKRSHILWQGNQGANLYEIRRIEVSNLPTAPNNVDSWPSPTVIKMTELNPDSGLVVTSYVDSGVTGGTEYAYAVKAFDIDDLDVNIPRIDSFDSGSAASSVYDENTSFTVSLVEEIPSGLRLTLNEEHEFSAGEHIYIDGLGFARIISISNGRIIISGYIQSQLTGATVYPAPGIVRIP